jgi:NarL family two-component system response regulator LiaR
MIVDDHGMVRRGLVAYLKNKEFLEIVGEASNGREAIEISDGLQPDVILMDLLMPDLGGVAAIRTIHQNSPEIQIIALTSFEEKELVQDALQAGAISYLLKNVTGDDLADAILAAYAGKPTLAPEAVKSLIRPEKQKSNMGKDLTRREREVLGLLVKGLNNPDIANRLCVSRATVKAHVSNILSKLSVSNRAEAIAKTIQEKILS